MNESSLVAIDCAGVDAGRCFVFVRGVCIRLAFYAIVVHPDRERLSWALAAWVAKP